MGPTEIEAETGCRSHPMKKASKPTVSGKLSPTRRRPNRLAESNGRILATNGRSRAKKISGRNGDRKVRRSSRAVTPGHVTKQEFDEAIQRAEMAALRLASIVRYSRDAIAAKDLNGFITDWNESAERIFGYKREEIIGKSVRILIPADRQDEEDEILNRVRRGESVDHYETVRRRKDGRLIDVSLTISPVKDPTGRIIGISKIARDITSEKDERRRLGEQARLLDLTNDAIIVRDDKDRIVYWNKGAEEIYGYCREEAIGRVTHHLLKTEYPELLSKAFQSLKRDGCWEGELAHRRKDGQPLTVLSHWSLDNFAKGRRRAVLETNVDITERKRAEERIAADLKAVSQLHELGQAFSNPGGRFEENLKKVVETAMAVAGADKGTIQLFDRKSSSLYIAAQRGFGRPFLKYFEKVTPRGHSACSVAMKSNNRAILEDVTRDLFAGPAVAVLREAGVRSVHSAPLINSSGQLLAMISVHFGQNHRPSDRELRFMDLLARQAADYLERKEAQDALAESVRQQEVLYQFVQRRNDAETLSELYSAALDAILQSLRCDRASILLFDKHEVLRFVAWRGLSEQYRKAVSGHSPWKPNTRNPPPVYVPDVDSADLAPALKRTIKKDGIRAAGFIPLLAGGKLIGGFVTYYDEPHVFTDDGLDLALNIARQLAHGIQRKQSERALSESEEQLRATVEQAIAGVARSDREGRIIFANRRFCQIIGYRESELIGKNASHFTHPADMKQTGALFERLIKRGKAFELEKRYLRKDGSVIWVNVSASPVRDARGRVSAAVAVVVDITARKQAEADLRRSKEMLEELVQQRTEALRKSNTELQNEIERRRGLEGQILEISDREQQRLAQELHDGICQQLTAIGFMARATALQVKNHRVLDPDNMEQIAGLVTNAASDARNIARALHRIEVDAAGFVEALQNMAVREIWKVPCRVEMEKTFHIDDDQVALNLYAIAREAVINANKHARAREILIRLGQRRKEIVLTVADDGVGLRENASRSVGMGFHIMEYRARSIGGRLELKSRPGSGTKVHCFVPVPKMKVAQLE